MRRAGRSSAPARRRRVGALEQLPVWAGLESGPDEAAADGSGIADLLAGLNAEQRRAVTHDGGPLLVVAGAGTGKTEVITRRIAWLIGTRRARPSEILALTFTDKAADEMQLRVDQLVPYGYTDSQISTFHAFGDRLVREFALELGLPSDMRVLSRPEVVIFLREHLFELGLDTYLPLGDPTRFLGSLAGLFSRAKDEEVTPERYADHAAELARGAVAARAGAGGGEPAALEAAAAAEELARRQDELARAYARYQTLLARSGCLDFGDQVALALRLLRDSAEARRRVRDRFRYILVDEYQDTNRVQSELVTLLAEPHGNLMVVGDDDQSIYRFRGAAIQNILEFRERYHAARTVVLRRNYRSTAPILEAAHRLVRFNDPDRLEVRVGLSKRLAAVRDPERVQPVRHVGFATGTAEADWIATEIAGRVRAGARPRDHAILVRANADADPILRALNIAAVPWRFSGTSGLYARPEVRLLLAVLRLVADPDSSADLFAVAASDAYGLPGDDLAVLMGIARRRNRSLREIAEEVDARPDAIRLADATRDALRRLVGDLRRLTELAAQRPAGEVLYAFLRESGLLATLAGREGAAADAALGNIARFFDIVRAQSAVLVDDRAVFVAPHLATLIESGDDPATVDLDPDADAVAVLTVHKAKGLEFPVVFVPGLVAGRFPASGRRESLPLPDGLGPTALSAGDPHVQEERRLFYVAMTRARDELILSHAADYGGARSRRLSRFVIEALDLPAADGGSTPLRPSADNLERIDRHAPSGEAAPGDPGRVVEPLTLSFGSVDDFLACPLRYRYRHVARVPIAPHHSIVYGAALHQAVQEFHRRQGRGDTMSDAELAAALERAWAHEGFVSREHEEARFAAGVDALRRFRASQLEPGVVPPAWIEREFSFVMDGTRIRGRFDRVDIRPAADPSSAPGGGATTPADRAAAADVVAPTLDLLGREEVVITDYKSSDVRDPAQARKRARESLQLQIYALAYEALSGRLPDAVQLHFLDSGLVGRADVDPARLAAARDRIAAAAAGIRGRAFDPTPGTVTCTWCPYREICPSSAVR
jgi:DNA helicase-2/ATP-dependent DNA helicase PcrA